MEQQFETLEVYTNLAKKIISKFAPTFYIGLRKELLSNDEAISDIASAIMMADWKWDANRKGHEGQSKTRYSYRNQCGIWAIKTYISSKYKKKNQYSKLSIDSMSKDELNTYATNIPDRSVSDPYEIVSFKEESDNLKEDIQKLLNTIS